jgi:hypothetical protein
MCTSAKTERLFLVDRELRRCKTTSPPTTPPKSHTCNSSCRAHSFLSLFILIPHIVQNRPWLFTMPSTLGFVGITSFYIYGSHCGYYYIQQFTTTTNVIDMVLDKK